MSESSREKKFTPGPWDIMNKGAIWLIYGPLGERICKMLSPDRYKVRQANAHLIAAAPELLELAELSCKTCYAKKKLYDAMNGCNKAKDDCHACSFYHAIAKAYGETP